MTLVEVIGPHEVALGSDEGLPVRRTLPTRARSLIGAWCFLDHYGPVDAEHSSGMSVRAHPHTGLQTVSWLFSGSIDHRDSAGTVAKVRPSEVNLMTAGRGISHSETPSAGSGPLHGVQLWVALPDAHRWREPGFEHYAPELVRHNGVQAWVFLGSLLGSTSPVTTYTSLLGAELVLTAGTTLELEVDARHEHGFLIDSGAVTVEGVDVGLHHLAYVRPGSSTIRLHADADSRVVVIGGEPLGESIVMWWNFIGRSHEEIVQFQQQWNAENRTLSRQPADHPIFGWPNGEAQEPILAPELPPARMKSRG
ncbi:MAG: pirin family protein [Actinomycetota bacterium]|nr:pirin family protein [Actinomycetota bacterium]MDP2288094.1 pirin family protein [Actinomycetota bacterium]